jgi:autotransporter-associated beta strand protein
VNGSGSYNAYGASIINGVTANGSAPSTINGPSWYNLNPTTTFTVADVTGSTATDLIVNASLRGPAGSPDTSYAPAKIIKEGAGTMEVTVHSYFRGGLDLNAGTLKLSGGNGGYGFFDGTVNVNSGTTLSIESDGTGLGWQGDWKPDAVNIAGGVITTSGTNHIWGIAGGVNMTGGTLQSNNGVSDANGPQLEWNNTNVTTNASASTATIGGRIRIRADGGYTGISFNVADGAASEDLSVSAAVTEASGGLGITKNGAGTMVLSGTNNYTGATNVSAGTLLVTGALGNSAVNVDSTAAIGGTGTVGGSLNIYGGGFFHVVNLLDALDVTGTVNIFSGFGIDDLVGLDWGTVADGTYTLINGTLDTGVFDDLANNSFATAYLIGGGRSAYFQEGSLQLVVIPEPSSALLGGLGMLALLRRRRA